jgi:hypothetical protein
MSHACTLKHNSISTFTSNRFYLAVNIPAGLFLYSSHFSSVISPHFSPPLPPFDKSFSCHFYINRGRKEIEREEGNLKKEGGKGKRSSKGDVKGREQEATCN